MRSISTLLILCLWVMGVLFAKAQGTHFPTPPGYADKTSLEYRTTPPVSKDWNEVNVNAQNTPRSISTFMQVDNTNNVSLVTVYDTAHYSTNFASPYIQVNDGSTVSFTNTLSSTMTIRSMTVSFVVGSYSPLGIAAGKGWTVTFGKSGSSPVTISDVSGDTAGFTTLPLGNYFVTTSTLDATSLSGNVVIGTGIVIAIGEANWSDTQTVQPSGGMGGFSTFTNVSANASWILNFRNNTGDSHFQVRSYNVTFNGDPISVIAVGSTAGAKDLRPRSVTETSPTYTTSGGTVLYKASRADSER